MNRAEQMRLDLGLTLTEAAEGSGVERRAISRVEDGKGIQPASLKALGDFYGVPASSLLMPAVPPVEQAA